MTCQTAFSTPLEPDRFKWPKEGQEAGQREAPPLWLRMQVGRAIQQRGMTGCTAWGGTAGIV